MGLRDVKSLFFRRFAVFALMLIFQTCETSESIGPRFDKFFIKYYGGSGDQYGRDVMRTLDGGYILVGTNDPDRSLTDNEITGDEDMILVKTDSLGNEEWTQIYDASENGKEDFGKAVLPTANGYLVVGDGRRTDLDGIYFETDLMGVPGTFIPVDEGGDEEFENITQLVDGYIIAGSTTNVKSEQNFDLKDFLTIKIFNDLMEDPAWAQNKISGREGADFGIKAFPSPGNPSIITVFGYTDNPEEDVSIYDKFTYNSLQFDGSVTGIDRYYGDLDDQICADVTETPGGFLLIGSKILGLGSSEMYYVKTTGVAISTFARSVFSEFNFNLAGKSITSAVDNRVLHLGEITYINGNRDIFLGKTNLDGTTQWFETFGDSGQDEAEKVRQNADGSIVLTGTMNLSGQNKIFLIKTNSRGQLNLE